MEKDYLLAAEKMIVVIPEYNGSFPGILKLMIDNTDVKNVWPNTKVLLVGVSTGRAGNLRGMEHLTGVLNYLGVFVHPNRLPVSSVLTLLDEEGAINDATTLAVLDKHIADVISW